jgi:hypothetical protein
VCVQCRPLVNIGIRFATFSFKGVVFTSEVQADSINDLLPEVYGVRSQKRMMPHRLISSQHAGGAPARSSNGSNRRHTRARRVRETDPLLTDFSLSKLYTATQQDGLL